MIAWDHPCVHKKKDDEEQPDETAEQLVIRLDAGERPTVSAPVQRLQMMLKRYETDPTEPPATSPV